MVLRQVPWNKPFIPGEEIEAALPRRRLKKAKPAQAVPQQVVRNEHLKRMWLADNPVPAAPEAQPRRREALELPDLNFNIEGILRGEDEDEAPFPDPPVLHPNPVENAFDALMAAQDFRKNPMRQIKEGPEFFRQMTERSTRLPRFKLEYASVDECRMRLEGTFVTIQDNMIKVMKIDMVRQGGEYGVGCTAMDSENDYTQLLFAKEGMNLRSPDPGYIQVGPKAYFYRRIPARIYKQGICADNTFFSLAGKDLRSALFGMVPDSMLLKAFNNRPVIQYDPQLMEGKDSLRLSDRVAVFKKNGRHTVEHKGVTLGSINGRRVFVQNPSVWVENALNSVGLEAVTKD